MKNLTKDQAELIFTLFLAQNADKRITEFVKFENLPDILITELNFDCITSDHLSSLYVVMNDNHVHIEHPEVRQSLFWFTPFEYFEVFGMKENHAYWEPFDIMKYISLEDKV